MGNTMLILKKNSKGDMRNSRAVTPTPPPCTSEETMLENTRNKHRDKLVLLQKNQQVLEREVTALKFGDVFGGSLEADRKEILLQSTWLSKDISRSLSGKPLKEIVLLCDKRKGPTLLNIQLNNGGGKKWSVLPGKGKKTFSAAGTCAVNISIKQRTTDQCSHPMQVLLCAKMQGTLFFYEQAAF